MLWYACLLAYLLAHFDGSDHSLDAQITAYNLKSHPRPSDYKSCYACYACYACLFISMAQITTQMLRSLPGRSNHSLDAQITPQTLKLQNLLCLLVHCDDSYHSLDAQITAWRLEKLPEHSNHAPESLFERLNHVTNGTITHFTLKLTYPTIFYQLYIIKVN